MSVEQKMVSRKFVLVSLFSPEVKIADVEKSFKGLLPLHEPDQKLNIIRMPHFMSLLQKMVFILLLALESGVTAV
jgi:hypothetical protein